MKEKDDVEVKEVKRNSNISKFATLTTLSDEELEEENEGFEDEEAEGSDVDTENESYNEDDEYRNDFNDDEYEEVEEEVQEEENEPRMGHVGNVITLKSKPTEEDIFRFMFRHTYCSVLGIIATFMALGACVLAVYSFTQNEIFQGVVFAAIFFLFAVHSPLNLKKKAKKQSAEMSSPEGIITYTFSEAGFDMERGNEYAPYQWSRVIKVVNGKTGYYVYLEKNRAFIATKLDLGSDEAAFVELLKNHVKNYKG